MPDAKKKSPKKSAVKPRASKGTATAKKVADEEVCLAAESGSASELAKLLKAGGNPNAAMKIGKLGTRGTAIYVAEGSRKERVMKVKALLAAGADVNFHKPGILSADQHLWDEQIGALLLPHANAATRERVVKRESLPGDPEETVDTLLRIGKCFLGAKTFSGKKQTIREAAEGVAVGRKGAAALYKQLVLG